MIGTLYSLENLYNTAFYHPDRWTPRHEDELTKTGAYQISYQHTTLKQGFTGSQCFVLVFNTSALNDDWISQIAISYYENFGIAYRTRNGTTKKWTSWKYFNSWTN